MYELAKSSREKLKAKARSLAGAKDSKTDSSDWSPAEPLNADAKTGMRPISQRAYKGGGKVADGKTKARADRKARKAGGRVETDIGVGMANKNMKAANKSRDGVKHVGGFKKGGVVKDAGVKDKKALGAIDPSPKRGAASNYKKGGRIHKDDGGIIDNLANALAGRGYIDGSTWLSKDKPAVDKTPTATVAPRKPRPAANTISPAQAKRELAMGRQNLRAARADDISPEQAAREIEMGRNNLGVGRMISASDADIPGAKKGGKVKKADGGSLPGPDEAIGSEERLKGLKVMPSKSSTAAAQVTPSQLKREEGYADADRRAGRAKGGSTYGTSTPLRLVKTIGEGKKTAKVYKDADWGEYRVKHFVDGVHQKEADYHASDKDDAMDTAAHFTRDGQKNGGRTGRATGGPTLSMPGMKGIGKKLSRKGGKTDINIVINAGKPAAPHHAAPRPAVPDMPPPPMPMDAGAPPPAGTPLPPPGAGPMLPPGLPLPGRKAGGRVSKTASSYKDMTAGSVSGLGRLQKTSIAAKGKNAPAN